MDEISLDAARRGLGRAYTIMLDGCGRCFTADDPVLLWSVLIPGYLNPDNTSERRETLRLRFTLHWMARRQLKLWAEAAARCAPGETLVTEEQAELLLGDKENIELTLSREDTQEPLSRWDAQVPLLLLWSNAPAKRSRPQGNIEWFDPSSEVGLLWELHRLYPGKLFERCRDYKPLIKADRVNIQPF